MNDKNMVYIHPAPVRVWHWINAAGFILLITTGFQIRFAEVLHLFSLQDAVKIHNYVGIVVIADYLLWLYYYLSTGKIKVYFPDLRTLPALALKQIIYYGYGIFKGDPNPHITTPDNKFNTLQQNSYFAIMFVLLPAQIVSGIFLWKVKGFESYIDLLGGVKTIDTIHVVLFFIFTAFLFVHCYLATLGHTPLAHFKAMFTGYEESSETTATE